MEREYQENDSRMMSIPVSRLCVVNVYGCTMRQTDTATHRSSHVAPCLRDWAFRSLLPKADKDTL